MVTSRDVQEIVSKLSSDKAKAREEGIKLLNTWLEGERSIKFCNYIGQKTAKLKLNEIPHSETWPFLISLLIQSVSLEISTSKRRLPKASFAKTLRIVVQRAEDAKFSGKVLPLLPVAKILFSHIWDVLSSVSSFQSEYGVILRHLLAVRDYRFHLRNRVYCSLMRLYIEKVETSLADKNDNQGNLKEEAFRCVLTLHSLLENPPGDFPDELREDIVKGIVQIFSFIREEGKFSRKLMECVNTYLLKDGPNLGCQSLEIHNAVRHFVFRCWLTTHDRNLKDALIFYGRLQLNLTRGASESGSMVEQFLDVVCKELDQSSLTSITVPWMDATKDEKFGTLTGSQCGLVELAALLLYQACVSTPKAQSTEKRIKREHATVLLKEALKKGKWLWNAAFCYLIRNYCSRMNKDLIIYWFDGISTSFERILNDTTMVHAYDSLLWTLRGLQELSTVLLLSDSRVDSISNKLDSGWQLIWSHLIHGLPLFSNSTSVADAALLLLGNILTSDMMNIFVVPQDIWDLKLFKQMPSRCVLYFIACYFSHKGSQGDLRDSLHLRKNLLTTILGYLNWKDTSILNEHMVVLFPAAVYALCAGCAPFTHCYKGLLPSHNLEASGDWAKTYEDECERLYEPFECSVEVLAKIDLGSTVELASSQCNRSVSLPCELRDTLMHEMETHIFGALGDKQTEKMPLCDAIFTCGLLSNFIHGSLVTRKRDEILPFLSKTGQYLIDLLGYAVNLVTENGSDFQSLGCSGSTSECNVKNSLLQSFRSLLCCPIFVKGEDKNALDAALSGDVIQCMERLLKALAKLYEQFSECTRSSHSEVVLSDSSDASLQISSPLDGSRSRILDVELDVNEDTQDVDILSFGGKVSTAISFSMIKWKMGMISLISSFFSVLGLVTWDILFEVMGKECETKVFENILYHLCQHPHWSSAGKLIDLVQTLDNMIEIKVGAKLNCASIVVATQRLMHTLLSLNGIQKDADLSLTGREHEQGLIHLGSVVSKVAEFGFLDWRGRVKLIGCICDFVVLSPQNGQTMIGRLFLLLRDPDYRVRFSLAQRIGVLFETWDGHEELFQDIYSNFGVTLVLHSKGKLVTAKEVLAAGPQPCLAMETIIITLMHLAFHSEKVELEAIFIICAVAAINPCHRCKMFYLILLLLGMVILLTKVHCFRELVSAVLDDLSRQLQYATRFKYLEELIGTILFFWVSCGVSLVALVEIRQLFVLDAEPSYFMQYCCHWLLPALVLNGDNSSMNWVAKLSSQPLAMLVKNHFVPIFSVCMALHCSKRPGWDKGALVLQSSILHFAEISENERDKLIKQHMVSIVSHILSLASCASDPAVPFFPRDIVARAVQTVVDGFLEMENYPSSVAVIDKINIFRPDRVFMFIVEMHYKIAAAVHHRHRYHKLAGIQVLIDVLGHRAGVASTSNYLFNLVGQFIGCWALQDQCCRIISSLLETFKRNPSEDIVRVLGEQLQFLVSKLVACCIPSETTKEASGTRSSQALSLLFQLTVHSDSSLHDYVRELEPFPETDIFGEIRGFHQELCQAYSPRDHLLKFVNRSCYLPPRLLLWSVQALHKKLLMGENFQKERNTKDFVEDVNWHCDPEIMQAVWALVRMCGSVDADSIRSLVSDFVSRVGIGDPHCVVFHLPGESSYFNVCRPTANDSPTEINFSMDTVISEELLITLLKLLKKYLMDDSVRIVDLTSQALRGILSTERGQGAILSFDSYERSLIEIHSKGVNVELVEKYLLDLERRFRAEAIPLEESTLWETPNRTFEMWICPLVYSLIGYSNDIILRLCQDIVLLKAEVAELLLPSVIVDLAGKKKMDLDLHKLISSQVQEHILTESNKLIKSIQVFLKALNELRLHYVLERSSAPSKRDTSKYAKPSSSASKSRSTSAKARDAMAMSSAMTISTSSWDKVYWLTIDYLLVAKSAVICGSFFTSMMYVEYWCEEYFNSLTLGRPDFSHLEVLPDHIEVLVSAVTQINEPDSLYGIIQSYKLPSQVVTFEHEGNWSKALEYYDLQVRSNTMLQMNEGSRSLTVKHTQSPPHLSISESKDEIRHRKPYKGLIRSLQQIGCTHVLDLYCQGLASQKGQVQHDLEFIELQYEAAWRAGKWDFSLLVMGSNSPPRQNIKTDHFNENLHSCLRAFQEGDFDEFHTKLEGSKQELVQFISYASEESTEYIYSTIIKLQILYQLGMAWHIRWITSPCEMMEFRTQKHQSYTEPVFPTMDQLSWLNMNWSSILERTQLHMNLLEPFIAFRRVLLQILGCNECSLQHLLQSTSTLRKGSRFSQASAALHEFKFLCIASGEQYLSSYWLGRLEEAKLLHAQGQHEMAISLAKYISQNCHSNEEASDVYRMVGKWLAETRSSNSRTILEKYLKPAVSLAEDQKATQKKSIERQSQTHFNLAHYADALFRSYEERLTSSEWQAATRLRKHKTLELEALLRRLKSSAKGDKTDYSAKIQELQKQLTLDKEEAEKLLDDRDNFLNLALEGYKRCLVIGDKYDVRVVFRLVSLWFSLSSRQNVVTNMLTTIDEVQSYKFVPLVYQIASRMGSSKDGMGPQNFQFALVSLVKKMSIDHPYHTLFQLLALANGDRIRDKQRSRNSFVVDMDKILSARNLLDELSSYHGAVIGQMRQMVEIYIRLAQLETRREDTNKRMTLPREIRSVQQLELVPVVTASFPVDRNCNYSDGSFPYFKGLADSVVVMNGINAPKVVECFGSDGKKYRQLAKSGNDDLRQDAVMEQFFGLVNTFLQNNRDTRKRRLGVRTYKVIPFTPSAGVLEWVNGTLPLGEYLIGSTRNGGAHGRYGIGDWSFLKCREHMSNEKDKRKAFHEVCENFRPVMHHFFLERFLQPADWFEKRLAYTRSVAASSMVGYIVGLGDRHSMNILIDQTTAEVVHIDLGVAFEQGLMLKTPERIPFRLTRDIIDAMGATGVEGVFRRCCEETLAVMRTNKEALLTIVEVFIHDPLYKWALSPLKALQRQKEMDDDLETSLEDSQEEYEGNKDAARALMRVKQKLDGYEEGELRSVHGQVQQLIQDATDADRLCQLFPGWGAWM
ncbi:serine/threonine-protein kinase ATM isoform X3 [Ricinus communis]|uniref:serine/threonine-protein kinase ATM isoform X3 n=1 Tax=Ricinus communis TaxID=3988 RepID=UPI00201B1B85|nr:serine/threonine-protein kinase ATM isoform X3 [Ricinus communis]